MGMHAFGCLAHDSAYFITPQFRIYRGMSCKQTSKQSEGQHVYVLFKFSEEKRGEWQQHLFYLEPVLCSSSGPLPSSSFASFPFLIFPSFLSVLYSRLNPTKLY